MQHARRRRSPSFFVAIAALTVAMGGTAIAQTGIIINSPDQLGSKVVTGPKLADNAVTGMNIVEGTVLQRDQANPHLRSSVDALGRTLAGDASSSQRVGIGHFRVTFDTVLELRSSNLDRCAVTVSPEFGTKGSSPMVKHRRAYAVKALGAKAVDVYTFEQVDGLGEIAAGVPFDLVLAC